MVYVLQSSPLLEALLPPPQPWMSTRGKSLGNVTALVQQATAFIRDFKLVCPNCKHNRQVNKIVPRAAYRWATLTCPKATCRHKALANAWHCQCMVNWRLCPVHSKWEAHARTINTNKITPSKAEPPTQEGPMPVKRKVDPSWNEPLSRRPPPARPPAPSPSTTRGSKRRTPSLQPAVGQPQNILMHSISKMPKLAAKFPHLLTRSCSASSSSAVPPEPSENHTVPHHPLPPPAEVPPPQSEAPRFSTAQPRPKILVKPLGKFRIPSTK